MLCRRSHSLWYNSTFRAKDLQIDYRNHEVKLPPRNELLFGKTFSAHMLTVSWSKANGWDVPHIKPFENLSLHPASTALHYGIQLFEGLKAYRGTNHEVRLFRPDLNAKRCLSSARRVALPDFDPQEFVELVKAIVTVEHQYVPEGVGYSLYIRPTLISTEPTLGVGSVSSALFFIICSPTGPYWPQGLKPIGLYADPFNRRACLGGAGGYKVGGNYAPTIVPQMKALQEHGCPQVLWLTPEGLITEGGAMNILGVFRRNGVRTLVTAPLNGLILPGVTRDSVLTLAREGVFGSDIKVEEREWSIWEVKEAVDSGELQEMFCVGTAAIVTPINRIVTDTFDVAVPLPEEPLAGHVLQTMLDIQHGVVQHPWSIVVDKRAV